MTTDTGGILGGVGSIVQGGAAIGSATMTAQQNRENLRLQKQQFKYQKKLQGQLFAREDNAVQRRAADLKAAGFNRVLAAGSGANAGPVVSTTAPQGGPPPDLSGIGSVMSDAALMYMTMTKQKADISKTAAEIDLIEQQEKKAKADTNLAWKMAGIKGHDLGLMQESGTSSNPSTFGKLFSDALGIYKQGKEKYDEYQRQKFEESKKSQQYKKTHEGSY